MAETLRIEIPIETVDHTEPELSNLIKKIGRLGEESDKTGEKAKKSQKHVTEFDRQAQKTEKRLSGWAKEKYKIMLEAKERISPILSTLKRGLRGFAGKTWNVTMRAVDFVTSPVRGILNLLKNPVFQVGAVLGISMGLKDAVETYKDFEAAMSQVQAISGAAGSELEKLTNKAKEMGATTKFTAQESAEAFNYMAMAGWKTEDMLNGIEGILSLAAASGEDLATTSDIVTDALTAFQMKAADAGRFSDVLAAAASNANTTVSGMGETFKYAGSMAGALGYSIEDVALMTGLMANTGIKGTMAGTALNSIFTRLSTNAGGAADAISALGIKFFTSKGNARALSEVMGELRNATAGMSAEQKSQLSNTIAGTEAQKGLLAILNASEEDYYKLADAIRHADGAAAQMSETMLDNLQGSITLLQSAVDGVKLSFGERLSPYIRNFADWLTSQMPAIEHGLEEFMDWVDTKVDRIQRKWKEITSTGEWQDANFFGKVKIAWDAFIAEPFSEWWNSTGKAKFAKVAEKIGSGIGAGLKAGVMTLLGIDLGETLDEGVSIGASFARGFSEGFDFNAISEKLWKGFGNLLSSAGKLLPGGEAPDLSSWVSAAMLKKLTKPFFGLGKGISHAGKMLFGANPATGSSLIRSILGTTGNSMVQGTGLLNILANAGYALTGGSATAGGFFGTGTAMSGGTAAAIGAAGVSGGVAAGATLISSALDAYKAMKSENKEESEAYGKSAAWKAGGVVFGATLGSIIPGLGTAVGALAGAGIGGIAGWIKGNKIKEEYQKNVEQMQKEAEKAQKVFEATGLSIEKVGFQNEALTRAMKDSEVSAAQFAVMFQEECAAVAKKAFGEITLSLGEVKKVAGEITFADMAEELDVFAQATSDAETALSRMQSSLGSLKKENWKVGLGMELSETDKDGYKSAIENFLSTSQTFIDDNHYQATVALKLLAGGEADTTGLDNYYGGLKSQIEDLGTQLTDSMNIALEDSVITLDEASELENLQNQITEITKQLTEAKTDAEMQALGIKYNGAALDIDSFNAMQEALRTNAASASEQYEHALTLTLTNLNLQKNDAKLRFDKKLISEEEYQRILEEIQRQTDEATEKYYIQINGLNTRVSSFSLESIATAWNSELSGILPNLEGTMAEKLGQALNRALLVNPDANSWTQEEVMKWFGLERLAASNAPDFETIYQDLIQTALAVPKGAKEQFAQNFRDSLPDVNEILEYLDWENYSLAAFDRLTGHLADSGELLASDADWKFYQGWKSADSVLKGVSERDQDTAKRHFAEDIYQGLETTPDMAAALQLMTYMKNSPDYAGAGSFQAEYCEQLATEWMEAGTACGEALTKGAGASLLSGASLLREDLQAALNTATTDPFAIRPVIRVTPDYHIAATGLLPTATEKSLNGYAAGGFVSGGPRLSWLAEEGYGEFVIPTNPSRRARAVELYEQAGAALGISAYAAGGYAEGSVPRNSAATRRNPWTDAGGAPIAYTETTEGNFDGEAAQSDGTVPANREGGSAGIPIQVNVSMVPEFVIQSSSGQSEDDIVRAIGRHIRELADALGGEMAGKLREVFSDMPLKGVQ